MGLAVALLVACACHRLSQSLSGGENSAEQGDQRKELANRSLRSAAGSSTTGSHTVALERPRTTALPRSVEHSTSAEPPSPVHASSFKQAFSNSEGKQLTIEQLKSVRPEDHQWLLQAYAAESELPARELALIGLSLTGDERVLGLVQQTLMEEFTGKELGRAEVNAMANHVRVLGVHSRTNPKALDFLWTYSTPEQWRFGLRRKWTTSDNVNIDIDRLMATTAIKALGDSSQAQALRMLYELAERPPGEIGALTGAIVDAIFAQQYMADHGVDAWDQLRLDRGVWREQFKWRESEVGRRWDAWQTNVDRLAER